MTPRVPRTISATSSRSNGAPGREKPLRFAHSKPLCLQYNMTPTSSTSSLNHSRRNLASGAVRKRESPSTIAMNVISTIAWLLGRLKEEIVWFLLTPAEEFGGKRPETYWEMALKRAQKNSGRKSPTKTRAPRYDYGRSARLAMQRERASNLCLFD
ncbi:hypothetical protein PFISCL1PPCAC_1680 [Pristionchus fissidentatus]|uniref:Ribosomal protein n=1 Tax=Pristionchus fissidentatus TaxID=1538716 RepID=A0AAV5UUJ7_9BILA|nr:hypothetical protein PFISCL1PPCAC_1680 [Pristionchus fissidentatus]